MVTKYHISLSAKDKQKLESYTASVNQSAHDFTRARAILLMDKGELAIAGWSIQQISVATSLSVRTLHALKERFCNEGLEAIFPQRKKEGVGRPAKFGNTFEDCVIKLIREEPPFGYQRWSIRLLQRKLVERNLVKSVSTMSIQRALKKMHINLTDVRTINRAK